VKSERNIRLIIEYNGTRFSGWQYQPGLLTIQGEIESAVKKLTSQKVTIIGAGRTDAGVHALGQTANFIITHDLPVSKYRDGLNFYLPAQIRIKQAEEVAPDFHARYDAIWRHYRYRIGFGRSALFGSRRWEIERSLDKMLLDKAAKIILGKHDFATFCAVSSQKGSNQCLVYESRWEWQGPELSYEIIADRFLHNMIRSLVGLMVDLGTRGVTMGKFREVFYSCDHTALRQVAPAQGLYLVAVGY
jgi:tRNA pseudouridine38-40 synthase